MISPVSAAMGRHWGVVVESKVPNDTRIVSEKGFFLGFNGEIVGGVKTNGLVP